MVPINPILAVRLALRWAREDARLTQARLAKRMGVSQQAYAKLESPDANFTMETLARAAKALGLRVEVDLVRGRPRRAAVP
jgi:transcriptional regulator with XRE-family HTH domain